MLVCSAMALPHPDEETREYILPPEGASWLEVLTCPELIDFLLRSTTDQLRAVCTFARVPLGTLLSAKAELIAGMSVQLASKKCTLQEARAYSVYRLEVDDMGGHQHFHTLHARGVDAVVRAGIFPTPNEAGAAVLKVADLVGKELLKIREDWGGQS